jgi:hypothetical protein
MNITLGPGTTMRANDNAANAATELSGGIARVCRGDHPEAIPRRPPPETAAGMGGLSHQDEVVSAR